MGRNITGAKRSPNQNYLVQKVEISTSKWIVMDINTLVIVVTLICVYVFNHTVETIQKRIMLWQYQLRVCVCPVERFHFDKLRPIKKFRHFADDIFKCVFLNENIWISLKMSLKFVPKFRIYKIQAFVQIMVWRRQGDKPFWGPTLCYG